MTYEDRAHGDKAGSSNSKKGPHPTPAARRVAFWAGSGILALAFLVAGPGLRAATPSGGAGIAWEVIPNGDGSASPWVSGKAAGLSPQTPLPPLVVTASGCAADSVLEVSPDGEQPFASLRLSNGEGRLPFPVFTVGDLDRLRFRTDCPEGLLEVRPSEPLLLTPQDGSLLVTNWGPAGVVSLEAVDAMGRPVLVKLDRDGLGAEPRGEAFRTEVLETGGMVWLALVPDGGTQFPVEIRVQNEEGRKAQTTFYRDRLAGSGLCATPGKDGAGGTLTGIVNTYYPVTASVSAGATSVPVGVSSGASTAITAGDLLLLIQMQDAEIDGTNSSAYGDGNPGGNASGYTAVNNSGKYEFLKAAGPVSSGSVPVLGAGVGGGTLNAYGVAASTASRGRRSAQLVRVPQYTSATFSSTLTCLPWNGSVGGILSVDVSGSLTLGGTVSVDGMGFRGGAQQQLGGTTGVLNTDYRILGPANGTTTVGTGAMKGEGIAGTARLLPNSNSGAGLDGYPNGDFYRGGPGNAGGGANDGTPNTNNQNAGGGGGGNGGAGGTGGNSWNSNLAIGGHPGASVAPAADRLVLGGGGGAGTRNNVSSGGDGSGAAGGGIVLIRTGSITGTGTITAHGASAPTSQQDGAGGGGAGGTILVYAQTPGALTGLTVAAHGGRGGDAWPLQAPGSYPGERHGPGGGGGGGAILLSGAADSATVTAGANGITTTANDPYGATAGQAGAVLTNVLGTQIPGVDSGAECQGSASYISKTSSAGTGYVSPGQTLTYTINVTNTTASPWTNVGVTDTLPAGTTWVSTQVTYPTTRTGTYLDQFNAQVYTGNNGSLDWGGNSWAEIGESDGPTSGEVQVRGDLSSFMGRIQNTNRGLQRQADCSGYTRAILSFVYQRRGFDDANDWVEIQVSPTGGAGTWTTLARYAGPTNDTTNQSASFDISAYLSATTSIRFYSSPNLGGGDSFYFDDVQIALSGVVYATGAGGAPPNLASGYTLQPYESLTATVVVTVNSDLDPAFTGITNTATLSADGGISQQASVTNPVLPAPTVNAPILSTDTVLSGTSSVIGGTVTLFQNGVYLGTATVESDGTWLLMGVSGLAAGDAITADVARDGATSPRSAAVIVQPVPPVVDSPLTAGATTVTGTSTEPPGSLITVYRNGSLLGTTTVLSDGTWSLTGISPALAAGDPIQATVTAGGQTSAGSNVVTVQHPAPVVSGPIAAGDGSIAGTSASPAGTTITVYKDGLSIGTTTVQADGTWTLTGVTGLVGGESITAKAGLGASESASSNTVVVTPAPPVVDSPLTAGATTVTGTSTAPAGSLLTVYKNGSLLGTTTVLSDGTWSLTGISPALAAGDPIQATVTAGGQTSADSNVVTVQHPAPVVSGPIVASPFGNAIAGTSSSPAGTTITVYSNGVSIGTTTVQADGTWSLSGIIGLVGGESITATAGTGASQSALSNKVVVTPAPPVVDSPLTAGATAVTGTSTAPAGSLLTVYKSGTPIGTAMVQADGTWSLTGLGTPLADGDTLEATVSAGGQTSALSAEVTVAQDASEVTPPPWVTSPIYAGAVRVSGTSTSPEGTRIDVFVDGVYVGSTTVTSVGTWTLNLAGGVTLRDGQVVEATATDEAHGLGTSAPSPEVVVSANAADRTPSPVIDSPVYAGATTVSGTSSSPAGTRIDVYADGVFLGTTTVQAGGSWTLSGIGPLSEGTVLRATATDEAGGHGTSTPSAPVTVLAVRSTPPIVSASLLAGSSQTIYGSSVEAAGSVITVYVNGGSVGTTTVNADGSWSLAGIPLAAGDLVKATVQAAGKSVSGDSNVVRVSADASGVTPPPVITGPVPAGAVTVSGTSEPGAVVDVYADGVYLGTTTADPVTGAWTLSGVGPLSDGAILSGTATLSPTGTSDWSAPVVVGTAIHLLRSDAMTSLSQDRRPIFTHPVATPPYPSLETIGPNHAFNASEGSDGLQPSAPGTADDDKGYLRNVTSGTLDPDPTILTDNGRPLVFYELLDNNQKTLKLVKSGSSIQIVIE